MQHPDDKRPEQLHQPASRSDADEKEQQDKAKFSMHIEAWIVGIILALALLNGLWKLGQSLGWL